MDSRHLKYYMASFWLSNAYLSKARGESFPFHMINAGQEYLRIIPLAQEAIICCVGLLLSMGTPKPTKLLSCALPHEHPSLLLLKYPGNNPME